jgi:hypothetical protein
MFRFVIVASFLLPTSAAFADSCTDWRQTCISSNIKTQDPAGDIKKCTDAANVCRVECKKGQKVFVGPFNGVHHPVTSCS